MCATSAMAIASIGIINAGNPVQAYQDGYLLASVNQDGEEQDAVASLAAGAAAAFFPGVTLETIVEEIVQQSTFLMIRAIDLAIDSAERAGEVASFTELYYQELTDWRMARPLNHLKEIPPGLPRRAMYYSGSSIEIIPVALSLLKFAQDDLNRCLSDAANFKRDCDTIATIAGCSGGALYGAPALRKEWIEIVEAANCDLFQELEGDPSANFRTVAERLVETLYNEQKIAAKRARFLQETLSR
jgi:hypothetical protein